MTETEPMTVNERRKYLDTMRIRYWQAKDKKAKSALLDEMAIVTQLHRKSLLRLINGDLARKPRQKQRGKTGGGEVQHVVEQIARTTSSLCASPPSATDPYPDGQNHSSPFCQGPNRRCPPSAMFPAGCDRWVTFSDDLMMTLP